MEVLNIIGGREKQKTKDKKLSENAVERVTMSVLPRRIRFHLFAMQQQVW